jgi:hypothetical protein
MEKTKKNILKMLLYLFKEVFAEFLRGAGITAPTPTPVRTERSSVL